MKRWFRTLTVSPIHTWGPLIVATSAGHAASDFAEWKYPGEDPQVATLQTDKAGAWFTIYTRTTGGLRWRETVRVDPIR